MRRIHASLLLICLLAACSQDTKHETLFDALYKERHGTASAPLPPPDPTIRPKLASASDVIKKPRIVETEPEKPVAVSGKANSSLKDTAIVTTNGVPQHSGAIAAPKVTAPAEPVLESKVTSVSSSRKSSPRPASKPVGSELKKTGIESATPRVEIAKAATSAAPRTIIASTDNGSRLGAADILSVTAESAAGQCVISVRYDDGSATRLPTDVPAPCRIGADASGQQRLERLNAQNVLLVIGGTPHPTVRLALEALGMQKCGRFVQGIVFGTNNIRTSDLVIERSSFCPARDMTKEMYSIFGRTSS